MTSINDIIKEHNEINIELNELDTIIEEDEINYSNLVHIFNKVEKLWNIHEEKEDEFFNKLKEKGVNLDVNKLLFQHEELRGFRKVIKNAIKSGSEFEIKVAMDTDLKMLIDKLRKHMKEEEKIFRKNLIKN